ncbi:ferric-dicitrate binding protein FerR (iron transport regulator) [Deinococcus metalli]|uniref:Ferric-dicitrate binding protein FerR (Iron transport regulator) n=1 Tax=Deinococcus metalli TaxID=1141878 RepID=A0A7W8NND3_9DEIO|nr:anti-sigma factor [Deinococcus metalli]MBB5374585.1 ferric-dicitrate binding protein FerR (iron transport regulator) [Deinococcus metalli]GHF35209.1 hypothetical protein GCM10017781_10120 [Deinococcus metalli]
MHPDERLLASALHQLSPPEEERLQAELDADPALRAEWQALHDSLATLLDDLDLEAVTVPADAEERLIARLHAEEPARNDAGSEGVPASGELLALPQPMAENRAAPARRPAWWVVFPLGLAAAVALLFATQPPADPLEQYARSPGARSAPVVAGGQTLGTLVRLADGRVYVHLDRPPAEGRTYQLWQIQAKTPVSLGVFDDAGLLTAALPPGTTVAVSVEPPGGSPQPTTTPLFAQAI